jgi:hypothetical protein
LKGFGKTFAGSRKNRYIQKPATKGNRTMNAQSDISMKTEEVLRVELEVFKREHADLDAAIEALHERGISDQLTIKRLKKQKLILKDKIARIEDRLTPDIIA